MTPNTIRSTRALNTAPHPASPATCNRACGIMLERQAGRSHGPNQSASSLSCRFGYHMQPSLREPNLAPCGVLASNSLLDNDLQFIAARKPAVFVDQTAAFHALNVTFNASSVAFHALNVTFHPSSVAFNALNVTFNASSVAFHALTVTDHPSSVAFHALNVTFHPSSVAFHSSSVAFHSTSVAFRSFNMTGCASILACHASSSPRRALPVTMPPPRPRARSPPPVRRVEQISTVLIRRTAMAQTKTRSQSQSN